VLIALLDADHVGHPIATDWWAAHLGGGWASCPLTQNGAARVMSAPGYTNPLPVVEVVAQLGAACRTEHHRFWPDDLSLTDPRVFDATGLLGPKQITDRYLLALCVRRKGRLVTFDRAIRPTAVVGAKASHIVCLDA
jgi:toxin-antitoxin system PIN domain toxin